MEHCKRHVKIWIQGMGEKRNVSNTSDDRLKKHWSLRKEKEGNVVNMRIQEEEKDKTRSVEWKREKGNDCIYFFLFIRKLKKDIKKKKERLGHVGKRKKKWEWVKIGVQKNYNIKLPEKLLKRS